MTSRAPSPSYITLPDLPRPHPSLLEFLSSRFPRVGLNTWSDRLQNGAVTTDRGEPVNAATPYQVNLRLRYYREVPAETRVPFTESIVYEDEDLLVADKPHFLPVTPSGPYVNECLLYRLRARKQAPDLVPLHRLDRETAGVVAFSKRTATRSLLSRAILRGPVTKIYEAIATVSAELTTTEWNVGSRIVKGEPWFRCRNTDGKPNAYTRIQLLEQRAHVGRFELQPRTGRQHQLRLHMCLIGCPIVNDPLYPELQPQPKSGFEAPLQLLARRLQFVHPITSLPLCLESGFSLYWDILA
jgi:tRNA pseudouridine32 synthase/23S rRNA pseudouridine746 synthase